MATFRKRNKKWQAIVRHKGIGTTTRSFISKANALRWVKEQEEKLETGVYGRLEPSRVTLGDLLKRYSQSRSANLLVTIMLLQPLRLEERLEIRCQVKYIAANISQVDWPQIYLLIPYISGRDKTSKNTD